MSFIKLLCTCAVITILGSGLASAQVYNDWLAVPSVGTTHPAQAGKITDDRIVYGRQHDPATSTSAPYIWKIGENPYLLPKLSNFTQATSGSVTSINRNSLAVGTWSYSGETRGFVWNMQTQQIAPIVRSGWLRTTPIKITDNGLVLCQATQYAQGPNHSLVYNLATGVFTSVGASGDMNESGQITGGSTNAASPGHGVVHQLNGTPFYIGNPGGHITGTRWTNRQGTVAARSNSGWYSADVAYLWQPYTPNGTVGRIIEIPFALSTSSRSDPFALNDFGWVLMREGSQYMTPDIVTWTLFREGEGSRDIHTLTPSTFPYTLGGAAAFNNRLDLMVKAVGQGDQYYVWLNNQ